MNSIIKKTDNRPATLGSVVDQLFHTHFNGLFDDRFRDFNGLQAENRVPVNVRETATAYEIEIVAPGMKKEDFNLSFTGDMLTVAFEKKEADTHGDMQKWIRREYRTGSFSRSFTIDDTVDIGQANARYELGILTLTLPKKEETKLAPRRIDVQ